MQIISLDMCNIDESTIERPASIWIQSYTLSHAMLTIHSVSTCPMDYCIPYTLPLNLSNPNLQCQFKRSGILCS